MVIRKVASVACVVMIAAGGVCLSSAPARAADDPSIQKPLRSNIQAAMQDFITAQTVDGTYHHYDPVAGKLLRLQFKALHSGIVKKGSFYVSCADFADQQGRLLDLDFLVIPAGDTLRATQAIVHAVEGQKRLYHLEGE